MKDIIVLSGVTFYAGDVRAVAWDALPTGSVQCVVTSPPYFGLRDYNVAVRSAQAAQWLPLYVRTLVAVLSVAVRRRPAARWHVLD
jgi:site-specific DNA-methyltransferase (cytosine-N4-specific)